jgi:hypothetical protein
MKKESVEKNDEITRLEHLGNERVKRVIEASSNH